MTTEQQSLWSRIEQFSLDEPGAAFPFSTRLARENRWSPDRAERAIREYKRFMFLGCVTGHPVSPSEDVDQVWHLHLVYTKSYWKDFCGEVLRQPFHHQPTKGGSDESAKFGEWYANTLRSYRKFFGEDPPLDIWPATPVHHELTWVDAGRNWIIRKPRVASLLAVLGAISALVVAGCAGASGTSVFDYRGPEFLNFFLWFSIIVFAAAALWRQILISKGAAATVRPAAENLDPYQVAYLSGKDLLATNAAIINLIDQKWAAVRSNGYFELLHPMKDTAQFHPLERALLDESVVGVPVHLKAVRPRAASVLRSMHRDLQQRGLVLPPSASARAQLQPLAVALIIPLVGAAKTIVGIVRDRPFTFILAATLFSAVVIFFYFARRPFETTHGERLLRKLREENGALEHPGFALATTTANVFPMAVALFGMNALQGTAHARMRKQLAPQNSGGDSGAATGCGGSSCGGGGSGCGGGGGGGGCGGCGGGS